jgi:hypothetical protein
VLLENGGPLEGGASEIYRKVTVWVALNKKLPDLFTAAIGVRATPGRKENQMFKLIMPLLLLAVTPVYASDLSKDVPAIDATVRSAIDATARTKEAVPVAVETSVRTKDAPVIQATVEERELNIAEITYNLVTKDLGEAEWKRFVSGAESRFKSWSEEYDSNNMKRFLDDRLIVLAPRVTSGKGEHLKEFCKWLALYNVFYEQLPRYIRDISSEDKKWIANELADFNWDRCAQKIKEKAK